jgi:hypothetical protein
MLIAALIIFVLYQMFGFLLPSFSSSEEIPAVEG